MKLKRGDVVRFVPGELNKDHPYLIGTYDIVKHTFEDRFPSYTELPTGTTVGTTVQLEFLNRWCHEYRFEKVEDTNG